MDFDLPESAQAVRDGVAAVAAKYDNAYWSACEEDHRFPQEVYDDLARGGWFGLCIPEDLGGSGAGILGLTIAIEEVAKYSNTAALMLLLTRLPTGPVMIAGSREQNERYVAPVADGSKRAAFCLSEPQAGSDVMGMRTKAVADGDEWIINGTKCWISGVVQADWYTVFAKTSDDVTERNHNSISAFIVERGWDGVEVGSTDRKMGVRGVDTGELLLHDVRVPAANVIGEIGGFQLAMQGLNSMRPIVAARGIGLAEGALMYATEYVKERAAFRKTIADMQGIQWEIAKLATEIEAARLLTYRAAAMADAGLYTKEHVPLLSMAKYYATEVAVKASNVALQMLGAAGYMKDHMTELYYRDAKQLTIVEGTSQVQLGLIAKGVLAHDLWWD